MPPPGPQAQRYTSPPRELPPPQDDPELAGSKAASTSKGISYPPKEQREESARPAQARAATPSLPPAPVSSNSEKSVTLTEDQIQERTVGLVSRQQPVKITKTDTVTYDKDGNPIVSRNAAEEHHMGDASGGYTVTSDGTKYYHPGTTKDGRVIPRHKVDPAGFIAMKPKDTGPLIFPTEVLQQVERLGLGMIENGLVVKCDIAKLKQKLASGENVTLYRPGFTPAYGHHSEYSSTYTLQIEKDRTFSLFYSGGQNAAGQVCHPQTYHHGFWDQSRNKSLISVDPDQSEKWRKWRAREDGDATAVSVAYHEKVAKAGSGFHTATRHPDGKVTGTSMVTGKDGKLTTEKEALTTAKQQDTIAKITSEKSTWSGTYVSASKLNPGIPPSYSFACQHNDQSGILNIKQTTLDALTKEQEIVKRTYALAINQYQETSDKNEGFKSLLTDTKMLLDQGDGKKIVVILSANGDVIDATNNNIFKIQVKDGQPISWVQGKHEPESEQEVKKGDDPKPSNLDLDSAPTPDKAAAKKGQEKTDDQKVASKSDPKATNPTAPKDKVPVTPEQRTVIKGKNIEALKQAQTKLQAQYGKDDAALKKTGVTFIKAEALGIKPSISSDPEVRQETAIPGKIKINGNNYYAFLRTVGKGDDKVEGVLLVAHDQLVKAGSQFWLSGIFTDTTSGPKQLLRGVKPIDQLTANDDPVTSVNMSRQHGRLGSDGTISFASGTKDAKASASTIDFEMLDGIPIFDGEHLTGNYGRSFKAWLDKSGLLKRGEKPTK